MGGFQCDRPGVREKLWNRSFLKLSRPDLVDVHFVSLRKADQVCLLPIKIPRKVRLQVVPT